MDQGSLAERLGRYLPLGEAERRALAALEEGERTVARGAVLRAEQAVAREFYVVRKGWLYSSVMLPEGNRQILGFHLPGDLAGDAALPWSHAPFSLTAATEVTVRVVDRTSLRGLFERHPRLALSLHALAQVERTALAERLASVGRSSAMSRVAALLVDLWRRLARAKLIPPEGVILPLTQEEIGDAVGLTAVHVNRMMRRLVETGLIARDGMRLRVLNEAGLARIGNVGGREGTPDFGWLPATAG
ncbi:Crp/Fnr family transcriptional regulator [Sphingomonas morindae]|uniref:Crp/Fnr family transcriptional regulator n=1 Tax=Sphingomonas morindae TaxID=1541170 RepID=A0ABY4X3F2_9SPHN|nr:Crp/Fnr family transcriptional regulator [Sphingomonas morindae]USI71413.1 Crp/Fnr family transcriptional regulator [Sphingomonas morindae]